MSYQQTLDYLFNSLPMYHRIGKAAYKADITNTVALMDHLGHPENAFRSIHVAGTNGKGSVCHLTAAALHRAGYKVGLYTSPHLIDFRERIRIDGEMIEQEEVVRFVEANRSFMESLQLSFFEMTVGLAFDYFARQKVDIAVIEVGMGGRLDSTNVITPLLSVITNIGFDHTQFLGDSLDKIAAEKAGIIKPHVPVVIGETHPATEPVFRSKAAAMNAPICFADQNASLEQPAESLLHCCQMQGAYQRKNLRTFLQLMQMLPQVGLSVSPENIRQAAQYVVSDTGLHGRWEKVSDNPLTICETAHNLDGISSMLDKLSSLHYSRLHLIYGCVGDKDYSSILALLPTNATFYFTQPSVPRALPVDQLVATAESLGLSGSPYPDVAQAYRAAKKAAANDDLILITGSIFLVADALPIFAETLRPTSC